jgi:hypothetical protein
MAIDGTSPVVRAGGSLDAVANRIETAPTGLSPVEQLRLRVSWSRLEWWLRGSELAREAWQRQFTSDPEASSVTPIRLGQAVLEGNDGRYYGLHQISVPGVRNLSIYDTPEDTFGTVLTVSETSISGKEQDASGERPLSVDEALKRYWDALGAFPELTGKWKLPEQGTSRLGPVRGIIKALNEGREILGISTELKFGGLPYTRVNVLEPEPHGYTIITRGAATYLEEAMRSANACYLKGTSGSGFGDNGEFSCDVPPVSPSVFDIFVRGEKGSFRMRKLSETCTIAELDCGQKHLVTQAASPKDIFAAVEKRLQIIRIQEARLRASGTMLSGGRYGDPYIFHGSNIITT